MALTTLAMSPVVVDTMADLKALNARPDLVQVLGWHVAGDGGGGLFAWDETASDAADGGMVILPDDAVSGRWLRQWDGQGLKARWFGVKADGEIAFFSPQVITGTNENGTVTGTDDTAALQAAMDAAGARKVPLHLPAGVMLVSDTLTMTSNVHGTIVGSGYRHRPSLGTDTIICRTTRGDAGAAVIAMSEYTTLSHVRVRPKVEPDIYWAFYPTTSLYADNCDVGITAQRRCVIQRCRATGFVQSGIVAGSMNQVVQSIADCCGEQGINVAGPDCEIRDCLIDHNSGHGLYSSNPFTRVVNCRIEWNSRAGSYIDDGDFIFNGNIVDRNGGPGLWIANNRLNGVVSGNQFVRNGCAGSDTIDPGGPDEVIGSGRWLDSVPGHYSHRPINDPTNPIFPSTIADSCHIKARGVIRVTIAANQFRSGRDDTNTALAAPAYGFQFSNTATDIPLVSNSLIGAYTTSYPGVTGALFQGGFNPARRTVADIGIVRGYFRTALGTLVIPHDGHQHTGTAKVQFSDGTNEGLVDLTWHFKSSTSSLVGITSLAGSAPSALVVTINDSDVTITGYDTLEAVGVAISS